MPEIETTAMFLDPIETATVLIDVEGISPLIPHRWSEKAKRMMLEKQQGKAARPRHDAKNPEQEAHDACYWLPDGRPGMPATAFKAAMVSSVRFFRGLTMTVAKMAIFVEGEGPEVLVPIDGVPTMREDTPRNATGVADLRYRTAFFPWTASLRIKVMSSMVDPGSVGNLVEAAGLAGVGDWRPSAPKSMTGTFGMFRVAGAK